MSGLDWLRKGDGVKGRAVTGGISRKVPATEQRRQPAAQFLERARPANSPQPVRTVLVAIGETVDQARAREGIPSEELVIVLRTVDARKPEPPKEPER